jgi:hypothetical protein
MKDADVNQVQSLYGGYFHETSAAHAPPVDLPKTISYTTVSRDQGRRTKKASSSQRVHQHRPSDMNCFENPSPMLGNHYSQWSLSRGRGSFAEFSRGGDGLNDFQDLTSMKLDLTSFSGISLGLPQPSHQEENFTAGDSFDVDRTSPSTVYSGYSPACTAFDSQSLVCMDIPGRNNSTNSSWWSGSSRINRDPCQNSIEPPFVSDGLPRYQDDQRQQYSDLWDIGSTDWTSHSMAPNTISPKALTLNVPSAPLSSSGSSQDATLSLSDSSVVPTLDDPAGFSGSETLAVVEQPIPIRRHRQMLPGSPPSSQRAVPVLPSNDFPPSKTNKKRPLEATSGGNSRTKSSPSSSSTIPSTQSSTNKSEGAPAKSSPPKRIEPKPLNPVPNQSWNTSSQSSTTAQAIHHRDAKDDFLVRSKLAGMSYKDIRRQGKFTEAESTLRGRFRTLTKHKAARVRKPEWDDNDVCLYTCKHMTWLTCM